MLDAKKEQRKRMFFMSEEGRSRRSKTITMLKGREFKESFTVYLSPAGVKDKLTSLDVQVSQPEGDTSGCSLGLVDIQTKVEFDICSLCYNTTLAFMSTKPMKQPDVSP